ncbi:MAG: type I-A CRISPR-associated protein Cas5 [Rubrobacteraceae bacterium]
MLARYKPTALFSLKSSATTSSGAKTLLVPTMYSVKMALVDAAFRSGGDGESVFELVKRLEVKFKPPDHAAVTHGFIKIQREREVKDAKNQQAVELKRTSPFQPTVAYREFCAFDGELTVAINTEESAAWLEELLPLIGYFGKRGCFFQFVDLGTVEILPGRFTFSLDDPPEEFSLDVVVQPLDDLGEGATFNAINTYSSGKARLGRDRMIVQTAVPYKLESSSRGYTLYRRAG